MKVLAGDIGGTKTSLAVAELTADGVTLLEERTYKNREHQSFDAVLDAFADEAQGALLGFSGAAAFGVAGPVRGRQVALTNLPWSIDADAVETRPGMSRVTLLNDLVANALGLDELGEPDLLTLQQGAAGADAPRALISAGTGLGVAALPPGSAPLATESGHAGFAPETEQERRLASFVAARLGRASLEAVLSGPAFPLLYEFIVVDKGLHAHSEVAASTPADAPAVITRLGLDGTCPAADETIRLFVRIYGSAAGNVALQFLATGGVFLGGGIAPRLADRWLDDGFLDAFREKAPMREIVEAVPVRVVMNSKAALLGAARGAVPAHPSRTR